MKGPTTVEKRPGKSVQNFQQLYGKVCLGNAAGSCSGKKVIFPCKKFRPVLNDIFVLFGFFSRLVSGFRVSSAALDKSDRRVWTTGTSGNRGSEAQSVNASVTSKNVVPNMSGAEFT